VWFRLSALSQLRALLAIRPARSRARAPHVTSGAAGLRPPPLFSTINPRLNPHAIRSAVRLPRAFTPLTARIFWLVSPINSNCSFSFGSRCWLSRRVLTAGSAQSARLRASAPRSWRDLSCSSLVFSASLTSDWALPKLGALVKPAQRKTGQQHARSTYSCQAGDRGAQSP